jgi:hypothetical protein
MISLKQTLLIGVVAGALVATGAAGEEGDQAADLAQKLQNPVAALISVPFQSNVEWGGGPQSKGFKRGREFSRHP